MMFSSKPEVALFHVSRSDPLSPLSTYSRHPFELDGESWPSVEHYYQAMKFESEELRHAIRDADHPAKAEKLAGKNKKAIRKEWKKVKETFMTRGVYIKCRTHAEVAEALLKTGDQKILETSQFDYFWGCGRDGRGHNAYGKVLMAVRDKLREEGSAAG
jgi:ribA/ribD-fused uncharacterized protein